MSVTPGSDEPPFDSLGEALVEFTGCVGGSLEDICSYGLTIGETYVPFDPDEDDDCSEDEALCSQAWVRVMSTDVINITDGFEAGGCGGELSLMLEVGVLRCFGITEEGQAPNATDTLVAALQAMDDMRAIYCAAMSCDVWSSIDVGQWVPSGPMGGQYGGTWVFTVTPK